MLHHYHELNSLNVVCNEKAPEPEPEASDQTWQSLVAIPVAIIVPAMLVAVPPSVIRIPAAFALGIQVTPTLVRLVAALAMFANGLVQLYFGALNAALAFCMIVRVRLGHGNEHRRT
jgi:hypothetical protein